MDLLTPPILKGIREQIVEPLQRKDFRKAAGSIPSIIDKIHANIPEKNRISYGIVHSIKTLAKAVQNELQDQGSVLFETGAGLFENAIDFKSRMIGLSLLSTFGLKDFKAVLPYFEKAAASEDWNDREICQMLFRKIIKKYPGECKIYLKKLASSPDPNIRRFVAETLRPVVENRWIHKQPCYSCSIMKSMFTEKNAYARTSVGNNLSDLNKKNPDFITEVIKMLVSMNDKNAYWIATRACRNRVKTEPVLVMKLLKTDEYHYKDRSYFLKDRLKKKKSGRK